MYTKTHLDCLNFTARNALIIAEITSPIRAIPNNAVKAATTPSLSSELSLLLLSCEKPLSSFLPSHDLLAVTMTKRQHFVIIPMIATS